jgi:CheY-like chemotaxis protein
LQEGRHADVLFTDVVMPGKVNARELARLAKDVVPALKVLFTSGYTQNAIVHNGRLDEGIELLSKPYRKDDLARRLRAMLDASGNGSTTAPAYPPSVQRTFPEVNPDGKILIVEDSELIRLTTVDMVSELGFAFAEAGNAPEALDALKNDPDIRILLTDLGLPGMTGAQLVREARKLRPDLVVIAASGYSEETDGERIEGATYLQKPFTLEQLREALLKS